MARGEETNVKDDSALGLRLLRLRGVPDLRRALEAASDALGSSYDDVAEFCGLPTREQA